MNVLEYIPKTKAHAKAVQARRKAGFRASAPKAAPKPLIPLDPIPLPGNLRSRLNAVRSSYRFVGICTGLAMLIGAISILFLVQGASDWWFEIPWIGRAGFLIADFAVLGWIYRRWLDRPLRKRLTMAEAALLVEKKWPSLHQCMITAVELSEGRQTVTRGSQQLLDILLQQTVSRTNQLKFLEVIQTRPLRRWCTLGGVALVGSLAIAASAWPTSLTLLERIFLATVPLPTKTIVVPITHDMVVPIGSNVELSARAEGVIPTHGRVTIVYSAITSQDFPITAQTDHPDTFVLSIPNVQSAFKYTFYLNDGHSPQFTVKAKVPPSTSGLTCFQTYPPYTNLDPRKLAPTDLSLLAGSHLKIEANSTDPLQSATIILQGTSQTVSATLSEGNTHLEADIAIPAKDLTGFSIHLVDESGVSSANETIYPIVIVPDNPPTIKFLEPTEERETITLRTKPVIVFEATDDFGLTKLSIDYQLIPPTTEQGTGPAEETKPLSDVISIPIAIKPVKEGKHYEYTLDVASQIPAWKEGYNVNYWIEGVDNNNVTGPGIGKSESKQFGIISLEAKEAEILERAKAAAEQIDKAAGTQNDITTGVGEGIPQNTPNTPPSSPVPAPDAPKPASPAP
jgi:hypothetical protein